MSESGGPLGFGEDPGDGSGAERASPDREPWLPGVPADEQRTSDARSRLPGLVLVCAGFLLLVLVGLNALRTEGGSSTGPAVGERLPPFAAPLVLSDLEGDVNLARERDQGVAGRIPACGIRDRRVLTSCALVRGRPAVIAFFTPGERRCTDQLDDLQQALRSRSGIAGAAVAVRGDRGELRRLVRSRGWSFPVVHDRDGGLANVYGVAVCPLLTFVLPGGRVSDSSVGLLAEHELGARLDRLARAAAAAAAR